ncbi:MAG: dTDP-4-amino-4,6-dideoxygalactose transaminase [Lachnospiraceae bacterium]|jgi:dTDP-4-amino-4,6-dideoxygalactose transaminase|nr:dTDP-4-amino-4,6-dideoxygalactose transaminase [Lachnospiraceae bacterium]
MSYQINFNEPPIGKNSLKYIEEAINNKKISGDGEFTRRCHEWLEQETDAVKCLLTTSCTHALDMSAILCGLDESAEVIMPSYTFTSTANAFVLRGAKIVFVDIRPDTMNINEKLIEEAITPRTKAIVCVHYAGVSCEMDTILAIAARHGLMVIEDAAQGIMSSYHGKPLGAIGDLGCLSFHETKNFSMGEGGALLFREDKLVQSAEIIREKGTDRARFFRGDVDKYTWQDHGSSYLPSELNAAYLMGQLEMAAEITANRMKSWQQYYQGLTELSEAGYISLPYIPTHCSHNAHMFYLKTKGLAERSALIAHLRNAGILSVFHYIPLHDAPAGKRFGRFHGIDRYTTVESERLLRLPLYYQLKAEQVEYIIEKVRDFYLG